MSIISKTFTAIECRIVPPRLNIWRTIYINFRVLPVDKAFMLPIFIYGKVRFPSLAGKIVIRNCSIKRGMIKIGKQDPFAVDSGHGFIGISPTGKIIFNGPAHISTNTCLRVFGNGELNIGSYILLGSGIKVVCNGGIIKIGDFSRIAFNTNIINSGFHSVVDLATGKVGNHIRPILIGEKTWIGNNSSISGGAKLKPSTIVGSGSWVNKDYTKSEEENQLIAGRPAKLLKAGLARVFSPRVEEEIMRYFNNHPQESTFIVENYNDDMKTLIKEEFD